MAQTEDDIALAAEYALGTLDAGERTQVETMMAADQEFAAMVQAWEVRLGALNQMVCSVEPRPVVWQNIKSAIAQSAAQEPLVLPETVPAAPPEISVAPEVVRQVPSVENTNVVHLEGRLKRWRSVASLVGAVAAALLVVLALEVYRPEALPSAIRPAPRLQTAEVKTPTPAPSPAHAAQYVALLQGQGGGPAFILTVDGDSKTYTVRKLGAGPEPGKSFELWLISDKLPRPHSLGVIGASEFTERPVLASYDADVVKSATYAVTLEPAGGSPNGQPSSAPVFTGKLIETVPTADPTRKQ